MILIVGGGLAAFSLGKMLFEAGIAFKIFKNEIPAASAISSGIINPISGRNFVLSWKYYDFLETAKSFYQLENESYIAPVSIEKHVEDPIAFSNLLLSIDSKKDWIEILESQKVLIKNSYQVAVPFFLEKLEHLFQSMNAIVYENFDYNQVNTTTYQYKDLSFQSIIFAEGIGVLNNPFFKHLPFAPNRGEALEVISKNFELKNILHKGKFICPFKNHYWIGSTFDRVDINQPLHTQKAKDDLLAKGKFFFGDTPFEVQNHLAAFRTTTHDRRPFIDAHPTWPNLFIFNGFGTKGVSLIPYFAAELIQNILHQTPISEEVQIRRVKEDKKYHLI